MNIFIHENEEKDVVFDRLIDILDTKKLKTEIKEIFKKAYNNYVGYYLFKDDEQYYKIFVLPKNIAMPNKNSETKTIKEFLSYIKEHYRLKNTYPKYQINSLGITSVTELSFDTSKAQNKAQDIEQFVFYKYSSILKDILTFFNTHKSHKRIKKEYNSQTVKFKINLAKNIKEINKTKIHQEKYEDIIYSSIATIAYGAIKLFIRQKLDLIDDKKDKDNLLKLSVKLKNILLKKYNLDSSFNLSLSKLISSKTYKFFRGKQSYQKLYLDILSIFGLENFFEEDNKELNRNIKSDSLFIRPELMYEWYVYDWIKENKDEAFKIGLEFDAIYLREDQNKKDYFIKKDGKEISQRSSEPDIVLIKDDKKIIIDAKWKKLKSIEKEDESKPKGLNMNDVLKLQRDKDVYDAKKSFLAFLDLPNDINANEYQMEYNKNTELFNFSLIQIPMNLESN